MGNTACFTESQRSLEYAYAWAQVSLARWWERGHIKRAAWGFPIRIFFSVRKLISSVDCGEFLSINMCPFCIK